MDHSLKLHGGLLACLSLVLIFAYVFRDTEASPNPGSSLAQAAATFAITGVYMSLQIALIRGLLPKFTMLLLGAFILVHSFGMGCVTSLDKTHMAMWVIGALVLITSLSMANRHFKGVSVEMSSCYPLAALMVAAVFLSVYFLFALGLPRVSFVIGAVLLVGCFVIWAIAYHEEGDMEPPARGIVLLIQEVSLALYGPTLLIKSYMAAAAAM
ncbi:hypothetical protein H4R19_000863 [Coemansia spiralis]|nr:hypothetical protein H4R19_000863 [Coemansia spiralis]